MHEPLVSVITACYRQGHLLPGAIESVLAQTCPAWELIVVNDGSPDETAAVAGRSAARDPARIRLIEQDNQGQARARQAGLAVARGAWLVQLDADDRIEPRMLELCLEAFRADPDLAVVVADALLIADDESVLRPFEQTRLRPWPRILEYNPHGALAGIMVSAWAVREVGGLEFPGTPGCEDWDLWVRLARCGYRFGVVKQPLARYRQADANYSRRALVMLRSSIELLDRCRSADPRLAGATRPPAPPIAEDRYARLRNGRVFYALGLAAGGGEDVRCFGELLQFLQPGGFDLDAAATLFRWGCQYALLPRREPQRTAPERAASVARAVEQALTQAGFTREAAAVSRRVRRILTDPQRRDPMDRLRRWRRKLTG